MAELLAPAGSADHVKAANCPRGQGPADPIRRSGRRRGAGAANDHG